MQSWPIHEAKARLSELVKRAQQQPQQLTSNGVPVAVVLSSEQFHSHRHEVESLVAFIRRSPPTSWNSISNAAAISGTTSSFEGNTAGDGRGLSDRHQCDLRTAPPQTGAAAGALV